MRAGSLARWCARTAGIFALGAAALAVAAGPAAAETPVQDQPAVVYPSGSFATTLEVEWGSAPAGANLTVRTLEVEWG
jgi:hypothetical protein